MSIATIRAIIADADEFARARLQMLAAREEDVEIVAECADGRDAVDALRTGAIDLVFLDVGAPRLDGFGVLAEVGAERMPPVIITSASSQFAVGAFEAYALDYLLKPFDDTRFASAVARARAEIAARRDWGAPRIGAGRELDPRLLGLLSNLRRPAEVAYPDAIAIRSGGQYVVVRTAQINWIEADGNYTRVYVEQNSRLLTKTLAALEKDVLDPRKFARVHRSAIVNTTKIAAVEALFHGDLSLVLLDGTRVQCSRRYRKHLEETLYFTT